MYRLKEAVIFFRENDNTIIQLGTTRFTIKDKSGKFHRFINQKNINLETKFSLEESQYINFLKDENLIIKNYEYDKDRFIKNEFFFENLSKGLERNLFQRIIKEKRVVIIGLGGLGTVVLKNLVALGVMEFTLVDRDVVETSNLNRQLYFSADDIHKNKVSVLKKYISKFDSNIKIHTSSEYVDAQTIDAIRHISDSDLIVNAADTPSNIASIVAKKALSCNIPFITAGVGLRTGHFTNVIPSEKLSSLINYYDKENRGRPMEGSVSTTNMLIGAMVSNEILNFWLSSEYRTCYSINFINFNNYQINKEDL